MKFNLKSRKENALYSSVAGLTQQLLSIICAFIFRTFFLHVLSREYLGIEGLFSNLIQFFSLAELGIGTAIIYRMYKPFADKDVDKIEAYLNFYKIAYHGIALVVFILGVSIYPFLKYIIHMEEIPSNVDITLVYFLFLIQSVSSYLFIYKQSLYIANQQSYIIAIYNTLINVISTIVKILILYITFDYVFTLTSSILITLIFNFLFNMYIDRYFSLANRYKNKLSRAEIKSIVNDTFGLLCHNIGSVVVNGTDNIVLSAFISLSAVGMYDNYTIIVRGIFGIINKALQSFIPSIGNLNCKYDKSKVYDVYLRVLFVNLWISSFSTICLYCLLNRFIYIWLDSTYIFNKEIVMSICILFYIQASRLTSNSFISGCGLFMKDKIRPLIESLLNIIISIWLANQIGIAGVIIGTIVSGVVTYYWREPYLLIKEIFGYLDSRFWTMEVIWPIMTIVLSFAFSNIIAVIPLDLYGFILSTIIVFIGSNIFLILLWNRSKEYKYFLYLLKDKIIKKYN